MLILLAVVALSIAVVQWRAATREAAAERAYPPQGRILDIDGTPVHVLIAGSGPDLVLIHGASGNLRDWTFDFADRVSDRYRVIMFDRPGLGWTGRLPGKSGAWNTASESPMEQAAVLQKAAALVGVERPIVLGHSFGGSVAMAWALSQPAETGAVVMVSAVSNPWPDALGWTYTVLGSSWGGGLIVPPLSAFVPESYVDSSIETIFTPQAAPDGYAAHIGAGLTLRRASMRANAQQVNFLRPHIVKMSKRYNTLSMPMEIVHGDADTIVPWTIHAEPLAQNVEGANLTLLEGIGHMPQHTSPQDVEDAIDRAAARAGLPLAGLR